jgi:hypothetical protein
MTNEEILAAKGKPTGLAFDPYGFKAATLAGYDKALLPYASNPDVPANLLAIDMLRVLNIATELYQMAASPAILSLEKEAAPPAPLSPNAKLAHVAQPGEAVIAVWRVKEAIIDCLDEAEKAFQSIEPTLEQIEEHHAKLAIIERLSDELDADYEAAENAVASPSGLPSLYERGEAAASQWVPVKSYAEISDGDTLLIYGNVDGVQHHLFHGVKKKDTAYDGQEIILKKKGNIYFNFGMHTEGKSWVKQCFRYAVPTTTSKEDSPAEAWDDEAENLKDLIHKLDQLDLLRRLPYKSAHKDLVLQASGLPFGTLATHLRALPPANMPRWQSLPTDFQAVLHLSKSAQALTQLVAVLDRLPKSMVRKMSADAEEAMFNARVEAINLAGSIKPVIDKLNEEATSIMEGTAHV